jgi:hypothetical protein
VPLLDGSVEVIVNNDSRDISEDIVHKNITYHYNQYDNLSKVYEFLLNQAQGEYVYFLEDDDYLVKGFSNIELDADLIAANYCPTYDVENQIHYMRLYQDSVVTPSSFIKNLNLEDLQLSQFIFKKNTIIDFEFPMDNNVHNDINLVMHSASKANSIRTLNKVLYYQTIDGGDNLSFEGTTPDIDVTKSYEFMKKYANN